MNGNKNTINMTEGSILKNSIIFLIPLVLGNILQLLYNAADLVVVSRYAGSSAMGAVGATTPLNMLIVNFCIGFSLGASVVVSKRFGANDKKGLNNAVHTAMLMSVIMGVVAMFVGVMSSRYLLTLMATPEGTVLEGAVLYMKIYFFGVPGVMVYNFGSSVLRAVGDTRRPLYILAGTGLLNVVLNLVLVIGFGLDVAGVAIATSVANYVSAVCVVILLVKNKDVFDFYITKLKFFKNELLEIVKIGFPAGLQSSIFSISNSVIQSAVNSFGEAAVAGNAAASNIEGFVYFAMNAVSQATVTGVSQNMGAGKFERAKKVMLVTGFFITAVGVVLGGLCVLFSKQLLGLFITDSALALEHATKRLIAVCLPYFLCGVMDVLAGGLRGMGYSIVPTVSTLVGVCGLRMVWIAYVLPKWYTPYTLYICWAVSWAVAIVLHSIYFIIVKRRTEKELLAKT